MGRKLLVADDSVTIQKVIKLALSSEGYDIVAISSGADAVAAIKAEKPDLVLIDVTLPMADAYEVKREVNALPEFKNLKFVLMYSAFEKVDERLADQLVFHGRLIKPFDPSNLRKVVSDLLKGVASKSTEVSAVPGVPAGFAPPPPPAVSMPSVTSAEPVAELPEVPEVTELDEELPVVVPAPAKLNAPKQLPETFDLTAPMATFGDDSPELESSDDDLPPMEDMHPIMNDTHQPIGLEGIDSIGPAIELPTHELPRISSGVTKEDSSISKTIEVKLPRRERTKFTEVYQPAGDLPPAPAKSAPVPGMGGEFDIKNLTDSTLKISGLDAAAWNIDESRKMKATDAPPAPSSHPAGASVRDFDDGDSTFLSHGLENHGDQGFQHVPEPTQFGGTKQTQRPSLGASQTSHTSHTPRPQAAGLKSPSMPRAGAPAPTSTGSSGAVAGGKPMVAGASLSKADMEAIVRQELQALLPEAIDRVIRDMLPGIAVDVIKREIDRVLDES